MSLQEQGLGFRVRRDTLQQNERIAHTVAELVGKGGWRQHWVHRGDLIEQGGDHAERRPQHDREVLVLLALAAQFQQRLLLVWAVRELANPVVDVWVVERMRVALCAGLRLLWLLHRRRLCRNTLRCLQIEKRSVWGGGVGKAGGDGHLRGLAELEGRSHRVTQHTTGHTCGIHGD